MQDQPSFSSEDINPIPTVAPTPSPEPVATPDNTGSMVESPTMQPFAPAAPGAVPAATLQTPLSSNLGTNNTANLPTKPASRNVVELVALIIISLIAVIFIALFIWKYIEWDAVQTDVDGQINAAIAVAVSENTTKLEKEFLEREKYPYKNFAGPADYGSLSFEYPKTWDLYVAKDASGGKDYEAYLNPGEVQPVSATTINALRVTIRNTAFDTVVKTYDNLVKSGKVTVATRNIGNTDGASGTVANVYTGELPSNIQGIVTIFKVRDKTVLLQTDAMLFETEYYKMLDTVSFAE